MQINSLNWGIVKQNIFHVRLRAGQIRIRVASCSVGFLIQNQNFICKLPLFLPLITIIISYKIFYDDNEAETLHQPVCVFGLKKVLITYFAIQHLYCRNAKRSFSIYNYLYAFLERATNVFLF